MERRTKEPGEFRSHFPSPLMSSHYRHWGFLFFLTKSHERLKSPYSYGRYRLKHDVYSVVIYSLLLLRVSVERTRGCVWPSFLCIVKGTGPVYIRRPPRNMCLRRTKTLNTPRNSKGGSRSTCYEEGSNTEGRVPEVNKVVKRRGSPCLLVINRWRRFFVRSDHLFVERVLRWDK